MATFIFYEHNFVFKQESTKAISVSMIALQSFKHYYSMFLEDELSYLDYIEQLSLLLFMKTASEQDNLFGDVITENFWQTLLSSPDSTLVADCQTLLSRFSKQTALPTRSPLSSPCKILDPRKLRIIIGFIDYLARLFLHGRDLTHTSNKLLTEIASIYDEVLTAIAASANSVLSQHHTSRILTQTIVKVMQPEPSIGICDPACGTGGFLISAQEYITKTFSIQLKDMRVVRRAEITGWEINESVARISAINLWFHGLSNAEQSPILLGNSLSQTISAHFDQVFCNPLFAPDTIDLIRSTDFSHISTDDPLLNMLQHSIALLKPRGKAAIILPDSLLSAEGAAALVREQLLRVCDLHTLLRLPSGVLPADIAGNVLFFSISP